MIDIQQLKAIHGLLREDDNKSGAARKLGLSRQRVGEIVKRYPVGMSTRIPVRMPKSDTHRVIVKRPIFTPLSMPAISSKDRSAIRHLQGRDRNRELVRIRDKQTCQGCGKRWVINKRKFDVHHLAGLCGKKSNGYDTIESAPNLITLCHKCHFNHHQFAPTVKRRN